jgi:hypothetical protein
MRRKLVAATTLLCLSAAGAAYAAGPVSAPPNTYTGNFVVPDAAGSPARPVAASLVETLGMGSTTSGDVGAPLVNIRTTTYGLKANGRYFPKCTPNQINESNGHNGKWNAVCVKGSLVASGQVKAALTNPSSKLAGPGAPCALGLWVYNGGLGKLTFFFTTTPERCDGLTTGAATAWTGTIGEAGRTLVTNVPEAADVSYDAGNINLFGSLERETLTFKKMTVRHGGKLIPFFASLGCQKGERPFSVTYTATASNSPSSANESRGEVKGTHRC